MTKPSCTCLPSRYGCMASSSKCCWLTVAAVIQLLWTGTALRVEATRQASAVFKLIDVRLCCPADLHCAVAQ
jgi:hypothetical protein